MDSRTESGYTPEFKLREYDPISTYREAHQDPDAFWSTHLDTIQNGLGRREFVGSEQDATTAIVIPSHNEDSGDKKGNIRACLYAISQLQIPEGTTVKVLVIGHNNDPDDGTANLLTDAGHKIEYVPYETPLRSFSYPLQAAPLILRGTEADEIGIIDADTVVNQQWLTSNHQVLQSSDDIVAVAGPRTYIDKKGQLVQYGTVKTGLEQGLSVLQRALPSKQLPFVKLVSGNSYYRFEPLRNAMEQIMGRAVTDGMIQQSLRRNGQRIGLNPNAWSVSDGEKFSHAKGASLPKIIAKKMRAMVKPTMQDHIDFIETELPSYFPDFAKQVSGIREDLTVLPPEQKLNRLRGALTLYEDMTHSQMQQDIAKLRASRIKPAQ